MEVEVRLGFFYQQVSSQHEQEKVRGGGRNRQPHDEGGDSGALRTTPRASNPAASAESWGTSRVITDGLKEHLALTRQLK